MSDWEGVSRCIEVIIQYKVEKFVAARSLPTVSLLVFRSTTENSEQKKGGQGRCAIARLGQYETESYKNLESSKKHKFTRRRAESFRNLTPQSTVPSYLRSCLRLAIRSMHDLVDSSDIEQRLLS